MANRVLWNVRCTAHHRDGTPCRAWSIRGGFVCRSHGGAISHVRGMANQRLAMAKILNRDYPGWQSEPGKWAYLFTPGRSWRGSVLEGDLRWQR